MDCKEHFPGFARRRTLLAAAVLWALAGAAGAAPEIEIVGAEFGVFDPAIKGNAFTPTRVVPHKVGQRFGWVLELRTRQRSVSVSEEYLLPNPDPGGERTGASGTQITVTLPRRNQISQRQLVPVDGKIVGEWEIGPGEPAGHRNLQVLVEGRVAASFQFEVK